MKINAAFIFVAPDVDSTKHRTVIETPGISLHVIGVSSYSEGEMVAKEMVENGVGAIELCAGFGNEGIARIARAVDGKAFIGAVKFDFHPGLGFKSGDELFQ